MLAVILAAMPTMDLCAVVLDPRTGPYRESLTIDGSCSLARGPHEICEEVVQLAGEVGVDPRKALALAFHEGRLRDLPSFAGRRLVRKGRRPRALPSWVERSTMQCKPRDFCPAGAAVECDYLRACMIGLKTQLDNPRRCVHAPRWAAMPLVGKVQVGWRVRCTAVRRGTRAALRESFARYHKPYAPAPGYADGVMRKYDRLLGALKRARRNQNQQAHLIR